MPIRFNVVQRGNPARPDAPRKYYPSLQSGGRLSMRAMAKQAADRSTLSTTDMVAAVESFLAIIPEALADGQVVELGEFGSFWLRSTSAGADSKLRKSAGFPKFAHLVDPAGPCRNPGLLAVSECGLSEHELHEQAHDADRS